MYGSGSKKTLMTGKRTKKMSSGQQKIASAASPKNKITGADFKKLRRS
jgi:hypothetical protein